MKLPLSLATGRWRPMLLAACVLLLAGCQSLPTTPAMQQEPLGGIQRRAQLQQIQRYTLQAKLAVQHAGKGYTGRLHWQHETDSDILDIYSPLGQKIVHITRALQQVTLTDQQGNIHTARDMDSLTEQLLGWRLPLSGLSLWILGLPASHSPYQAVFLPGGEPAQLKQDGWQIDYDAYQPATMPAMLGQTVSLPGNLRLQQGDVRLKLIVVDWQASAPL